jgi:hypothetical protein
MTNIPQNEQNPFAVYSNSVPPVTTQAASGIFRNGNLLVVHKQAILPDRCVKSNEPTQERLTRKLFWHHPALYLLILLNLLIYAIVALAVRKNATFDIPLAPRYKAARIKWMVIAWSIILGSIAVLILGLATAGPGQDILPVICMIQFPIAILIGALIGIFGCRVIYATKIDDQYAWIAGTCADFRNSFPDWPYSK